jgi:hypothetical protein
MDNKQNLMRYGYQEDVTQWYFVISSERPNLHMKTGHIRVVN